jgi:DNA-binding CsgD family transcriptional regulator
MPRPFRLHGESRADTRVDDSSVVILDSFRHPRLLGADDSVQSPQPRSSASDDVRDDDAASRPLCRYDVRHIFRGAVTTLSRSDLEARLGFLREAAAVTGPDPFRSELLDRLRQLVRCDFVAYQANEDAARGRPVAHEECARSREIDASQPAELEQNFWRLEDHPLCAYVRRTGDLTAHKISDFVTRRHWHRLEAYVEYFRFFGVEDKMLVGLPAPPGYRKVVGLDRCGDRDFGERERLLLNLLRPHLSALDTAARERRLAAALLLDREGAGLVVLRSFDKAEFATPAAERLLARYFECTSDGDLPAPVRTWLHCDSERLNGNGLPPPATAPLRVERGDRRLTIRRAGHTLLLDEELAALTRREREVVDQLAAGCSNAEIADRLTIAPTTVRKHLENIYAKLEVTTRTAAVAATRAEIGRPQAAGHGPDRRER